MTLKLSGQKKKDAQDKERTLGSRGREGGGVAADWEGGIVVDMVTLCYGTFIREKNMETGWQIIIIISSSSSSSRSCCCCCKKAEGVRNWRTSGDHRNNYSWGGPEYWEESWKPEETCSHLDSRERPSANAGVKNSQHRIKLKECEKKDKYLDLGRELKKLWNMQVTIILIVIGAFGTVTKGLLKGLEDLEVGGRVETIQTTALLRPARILRRIRETWGELLSLRLQWKTIG